MASVGEVKAQLSEASLKCGEAWGALETAKEQVGAALAASQEAHEHAGAAFDGSSHPNAAFAVTSTEAAVLDIRALMNRLASAQDQLMVAQNAAELYIGTA